MDRFKISTLRAYYGGLLTDKQNKMIELHYDDDMSYGEIAEMFQVSRNAVLDSITKGVKHLEEYESVLKLVEKETKIDLMLDELISSMEDDKAISKVKEIKKVLEG
ncbi:MAG: DNA-binding protein [Clostridia bacterium]|nr:DNA-binding protein [Clostridia bacterium]MBO5982845.1 DNA-binding protein [Clostridia bacterium]MBO7151387.1 DNA-binding protein [Clostridia bacterium]MBO7222124.1 DNA-binding protein [Clostridia bacterium]MBO7326887.1 DNA-binding protein [Clostridia bacterium]